MKSAEEQIKELTVYSTYMKNLIKREEVLKILKEAKEKLLKTRFFLKTGEKNLSF